MKSHRYSFKAPLLALVVIVAGALVFAVWRSQRHGASDTSAPQATGQTPQVNLSPATDQEKSDSEQHKEDTTLPAPSSNTETPNKKAVSPVIVNATMGESLTIRAYVSGVYEDGGTCTIEAVLENNKVSRQSEGFKDATTTICTAISIPRSEFSKPGNWKLTLTYDSTTAHGVSQTISTEIK